MLPANFCRFTLLVFLLTASSLAQYGHVVEAAAAAPTILLQPADTTVTVGATATFTVSAAGTPPLHYQWRKGGAAISGATASSYTTPATTPADSGASFSVTVRNSAGYVTSMQAILTVTAASLGTDVVTYKNDLSRTGQNLTETTLTPANVTVASFGLLRMLAVDGKVDAQPLYLSQFNIGNVYHNVVLIATEHDSVYAFDVNSGAILWQVSLLAAGETPSDNLGCNQITPEIGITATPVIDRTAGAHGAVYLVAMSKDSSARYHHRVHALDLATGAELAHSPVAVAATYPTASGTPTSFVPKQYDDRAALLLLNKSIYTSWTSHCDDRPYTGWIIGYNQSTLSRTTVLNLGPNGGGTGPAIWMGGGGPAADSSGNIYLLAANGPFETTMDANGFPTGQDYGNSFIKLAITGSSLGVADYFAMSAEETESAEDLDLGASGELLLPDQTDANGIVRHLMVGAGKDGDIYVVNRDSMGKFSTTVNQNWQTLQGVVPNGVRSSPAYFNGTVYYSEKNATLKAFGISAAMLSTTPTSQTTESFTYPGTAPSISANGTTNAILWAHENTNPAVLHAYNAANLSQELYNSNQAPANRDQFGAGNKFIVPTIADGKVLVGTTSAVAVFGLLPP